MKQIELSDEQLLVRGSRFSRVVEGPILVGEIVHLRSHTTDKTAEAVATRVANAAEGRYIAYFAVRRTFEPQARSSSWK
jgi:hypothetical protein